MPIPPNPVVCGAQSLTAVPLLTLRLTLDSETCHQRSIAFPFTVPPGLVELDALLAYDPPELTDPARTRALLLPALAQIGEPEENWPAYAPIGNLITLSLDDPAGYRGNAHRKQVCQWHVLRPDYASPGFHPGPIRPGPWRAMLHVHSLVTESCELTLQITGVKL